jgi:hypothetical protein
MTAKQSTMDRPGGGGELQRVCLEILADAVDRSIGSGFVHAAVSKASQTMTQSDYERADKAFRLLSPRESRKVREAAVETATLQREHGDYIDPMAEIGGNPAYSHIRSKSTKLGN